MCRYAVYRPSDYKIVSDSGVQLVANFSGGVLSFDAKVLAVMMLVLLAESLILIFVFRHTARQEQGQ